MFWNIIKWRIRRYIQASNTFPLLHFIRWKLLCNSIICQNYPMRISFFDINTSQCRIPIGYNSVQFFLLFCWFVFSINVNDTELEANQNMLEDWIALKFFPTVILNFKPKVFIEDFCRGLFLIKYVI